MIAVHSSNAPPSRKKQYTTVSGKGVRARQVPLRGWRWPSVAIAAWVYFLLAVVLPLAALLVSVGSDQPVPGQPRQLFEAGALSSLWGWPNAARRRVFTSRAQQRHRRPGRRGCDWHRLLFRVVLHPVPHQRLGPQNGWSTSRCCRWRSPPSCWAWACCGPGWPCRSRSTAPWSCWSSPVIAVFIPQGYRGVSSSIIQLDQDLEDSAIMLGARRTEGDQGYVTVPLLRVGLSSTFLLLLMLGMRELTAALFLFTSDTRLLSIAIFDAYDNGSFQQAAELSLLYIVVIGILAVLPAASAQRSGLK